MKKDFERGRKYERINNSKFFHLFFGWACVIMSFAWYFLSIWEFKQRLFGMVFSLVFGLLALILGYSEKKQLREMENE